MLKESEESLGMFINKFFTIYSQITTNENYIALLSTISFIDYKKWSDKSYSVAREFLEHCFNSLREKPEKLNL